MKVTVVGHSCLQINTAAGTLLVDPWLFGSCYWRSWWHFPPSAPDAAMLSPDFIYLTHHHFDHFHYPSMRKIDRTARVLVSRFGVDVMAGEVESLGFGRPTEMPHGKVIDLGRGVRVASYQYGFDDSALVVADGDQVLVDFNDAKTRGRALDQITKRFGRPTLAFKSHSFAQSYPVLYSADDPDDPDDLTLVSRDTYLDDFYDTMSRLQPTYAVPFGSMVGFLHPESWAANEHLITPAEVAASMTERDDSARFETVTMSPGDSWSSTDGFTRTSFDWYEDRMSHLASLRDDVQPKLDAQAASEQGKKLKWSEFKNYFEGFATSIPRLVARRMVTRRIVFEVSSDEDSPYWWISLSTRRMGRSTEPPEDRAGIIRVAEAVLAEAIERRIFHMIHGSMRIRTHLTPGGVHSDLAFWGLLMVWELGYLPLRNQLWRPRFWIASARRHRELLGQATAVMSRQPLTNMARRFGAKSDTA